MRQIETLSELKTALYKAGQEQEDENPNMDLIESIAYALLNKFCIKKGDKIYRFVEIEFYHNKYDPKSCDKKTYPRTINEGKWFFHASGVDITFASDCRDQTDNKKYGGILIRTIDLVKDDNFVCGPQKVVDELFSEFDAFLSLQNIPYIDIYSNPSKEKIVQLTRYNFDDKLLGFCLPKPYWKNSGKTLYPWYVGTEDLKPSRTPKNTQELK